MADLFDKELDDNVRESMLPAVGAMDHSRNHLSSRLDLQKQERERARAKLGLLGLLG